MYLKFWTFILSLTMIGCSTGKTADSSYALDNVWASYDSFNRQYLDSAGYIYKNTSADSAAVDRWNGAAAIWCQPMYVDMALNAMMLAQSVGDSARMSHYRMLSNRLIDGNIAHYHGFDFDNNDTNKGWFIYDDIQWWTITLARAAAALHRDDCLNLAEKSFARVWYGSPKVGDSGSYADPKRGLGGGMFWQWQPIENPEANKATDGKMSCINFPTVVAAMTLYNLVPETMEMDSEPERWTNGHGEFVRPHYETKDRYFEMAKEIYDWSVENLVELPLGKVADHRHGDHAGGHPLLYNQGTFIGASVMLYLATGDRQYLDNAIAGADYSINALSTSDGYMPWAHNEKDPYSQGSLEQGIYPAIWGQYMKSLIDDCGQDQYLPYIEKNIVSGWENRDTVRNLCDGESGVKTPSDAMIGSYAASSIPSLMLLFPPLVESTKK